MKGAKIYLLMFLYIFLYVYFPISLLQNISVFVCVFFLPTMENIASIELAER